jgi:hypothetical protein
MTVRNTDVLCGHKNNITDSGTDTCKSSTYSRKFKSFLNIKRMV